MSVLVRASAMTSGALSALSCTGDLDARLSEYQLLHGAVRDLNSGATLFTFCRGLGLEQSEVVVFSAPPGAIVEEEVLIEGRSEKYHGGVPPSRDDAFWCSSAPEVYLRPIGYWSCLRAAEADPPASILSVERRGELGIKETSSGYALKLEVRHPGVLRTFFDPACMAIQSGSPLSDAAMPVAHGELTIQ